MNCLQDDHPDYGGNRKLHPRHPNHGKNERKAQTQASAAEAALVILVNLLGAGSASNVNSSQQYTHSPRRVLDSAASHHMLHRGYDFKSLSPIKQTVNLADNQTIEAIGKGHAALELTDGNRIELLHAFLVPALRRSLISAAQISKTHYILMRKEKFFILPRSADSPTNILASGTAVNGVFHFNESNPEACSSTVKKRFNIPAAFKTIHEIYGHANPKALKRFIAANPSLVDLLGKSGAVYSCAECSTGK